MIDPSSDSLLFLLSFPMLLFLSPLADSLRRLASPELLLAISFSFLRRDLEYLPSIWAGLYFPLSPPDSAFPLFEPVYVPILAYVASGSPVLHWSAETSFSPLASYDCRFSSGSSYFYAILGPFRRPRLCFRPLLFQTFPVPLSPLNRDFFSPSFSPQSNTHCHCRSFPFWSTFLVILTYLSVVSLWFPQAYLVPGFLLLFLVLIRGLPLGLF